MNFVSRFPAPFILNSRVVRVIEAFRRRVYRLYSLFIPDRITNQVSLLQLRIDRLTGCSLTFSRSTDASIVSVDGELMIDHLSTIRLMHVIDT